MTTDRTENAERINFCEKCSGKGVYQFSPRQSGPCYQCEGKGYTTPADDVRCQIYWTRRFASMIAEDCRRALETADA